MRARLLIGLASVLVLGCGSRGLAPVSGRVTLNGKPLAGATVTFQPIAQKGSIEAGPGSSGKTNENGEFTLTTATGQRGAQVSEHRVSISVMNTKPEDDDRRRRGSPRLGETIPSRYSSDTELKFVVPSGGTKTADFALTSP
jgi:hypothetical protein